MTPPQTPRRSLLLTYHDPQCTNYGAGQRTHFLLKALGQYATTDVVLLSETDAPNHTTDLPAELGGGKLFHLNYVPKNLLDRAWCGLPSKRLSTLLTNTIDFNQYDCIVCRYITPYLKFNLPGNKPLIIDFDDPIYSISWSLLNSPRALLKEAVKWLNQRLITWRLKAARLKSATFLFVCERDQKAFPQLKGGLLSNMPAFPQHPADYSASDGKTLLFVGFMSWQPNIIAVEHFLAHIWPKILAKNPSAQFRIVGKSTPENLKRWNTFPNCIAEGYAENIDAAYKNAAICVVPVLSGGGSNIKVPEALAHNRPGVVSVYAFNGWRNYFVENKDLLVAYDDDAFAAHCTALLTDRELALKLAQTGHHSVLRKLSFDSFAKQVGYTLQSVFPAQTQ
ncbi:MAG: glycosyltransferase family 4 protein [Rugosibacter sp.]|nr:glycosyltransferase family 4 protein [Rugosibacter sp.]